MRPSTPKTWVLKSPAAPELAAELAAQLGVSDTFARLLANRGFTSAAQVQSFLVPSTDRLLDPSSMRDMDRAVDRVLQALAANEPILVFGDYDVDGITSTSLLTATLAKMGARVSYFIPDRIRDGYGFSERGVEVARKRRIRLVITADCGITATREVAMARDSGIDVIVTDHHEPLGELPQAAAVLNPKRKDCTYAFKELAGVGVVFKLVQGLAARRPDLLPPEFVFRHLDLVALGTIADVVPLVGENRVFAKIGLERLCHSDKPGIVALKEVAGLRTRRVESGHVAYILAPRINAAGRLGNAESGVRLLLSTDPREAAIIAESLEEDNANRKKIDESTLEDALQLLKSHGADLPPAIVLWSDRWHPGVLGIVASRLIERFHRPTILIASDGDEGKGSGRSIPGFDVCQALQECREYLLGFGGHSYAAGLTIKTEFLEAFREKLCAVVSARVKPEDFIPKLSIDGPMDLGHLNEELVELLDRLAPFGIGNAEPLFVADDVTLSLPPSVVSRNHLKLTIRQDGRDLDCIGFGMGHLAGAIHSNGGRLSVAFVPTINVWQNRSRLQLKLRDIQVR
ncbi:MAG TPA: single-stranded-DNA-specific exonuclease RecJ [Candidatus Limnocylindrales bacterium]|nr:single-stranded-DNA-specific exonuclease RecJ [Candidatus Limnocylindrales bacterium]